MHLVKDSPETLDLLSKGEGAFLRKDWIVSTDDLENGLLRLLDLVVCHCSLWVGGVGWGGELRSIQILNDHEVLHVHAATKF